MIVEIHHSVVGQIRSGGEPRRRAIRGLRYIATTRREGTHILYFNREVGEFLGSLGELTGEYQAIYRQSTERLPQKKTVVERVNRRLQITGDMLGDASRVEARNEVVLQMPVNEIDSLDAIRRPVLIAEDLTDAAFYKLLGEAYAILVELGPVGMRFEDVHGGGAATPRVFGHRARQCDRLTLCIVDSDRRFPEGPTGLVAQQTEDADIGTCVRTEVQVIEARTIENLVPSRVLLEVLQRDGRSAAPVQALEAIADSPASDVRQYLDFKSGSTLRAKLAATDGDEADYWHQRATDFAALSQCDAVCIDNLRCRHPDDCQCTLVDGMGRNVLRLALEYMRSQLTSHRLVHCIELPERSEWERLGRVIFSWGCSGSRVSAT